MVPLWNRFCPHCNGVPSFRPEQQWKRSINTIDRSYFKGVPSFRALQVVLRTHYLLFRGQTVRERAVVLGLLRQLKAQSAMDGEAERRKLRGARN